MEQFAEGKAFREGRTVRRAKLGEGLGISPFDADAEEEEPFAAFFEAGLLGGGLPTSVGLPSVMRNIQGRK